MSNFILKTHKPMLATLVSCLVLSACGGGGGSTPANGALPSSLPASAPVVLPATPAAPATPDTPVAESQASSAALITVPSKTTSTTLVAGEKFTDVTVKNPGVAQTRVPFTFGQVFAVGHVPTGQSITGKLADGSNLPLQVDVKARHADGSVRHAVISGMFPSLAANSVNTIGLVQVGAPAAPAATGPTTLLSSGFSASINVTMNGKQYSASADALLRSGSYTTWLSGVQVNEWHVSGPLKAADGSVHPHLAARFAIRNYGSIGKTRVDATVENTWAYEPNPQNYTYDVRMLVGGTTVFEKAGLTHYHHARWRKLAWSGSAPQIDIAHNTAYLIATKALPNYDQSAVVPEAVLNSYATRWTGAITEPMNGGLAVPYMPMTGGRIDIGILPGWASTYLISMDARVKNAMLGTADLAGTWSIHYRDQNTSRPISIVDFPYMAPGSASDTWNPLTQRSEALPTCASVDVCRSAFTDDTAHQPGFAYLPYIVTGDYYYLEELQFWASYSIFNANPQYRDAGKGVMHSEQVRGQAWTMRSLFEAAYITPDSDRLKQHFIGFVGNNLTFYNTDYANNPAANKLGVITHSYAVGYLDWTAIGPWQDDFFTAAMGHGAELGFTEAKKILAYKITFPIGRMTGAGACWISAGMYNLKIRATGDAPFFTTIGEAYAATVTPELRALGCNSPEMAAYLQLKVGEMVGYAFATEGYPSNMQPALAYAADAGGAAGKIAWGVFANRTVKPDYGSYGNQFDIIPR